MSAEPPYHPDEFGCGVFVTLGVSTVFWPGDTDIPAEHEHVYIEVVCPPIGGAFTMDRHPAADLAEALDPDLGLSVDYDTFDAIETDAGPRGRVAVHMAPVSATPGQTRMRTAANRARRMPTASNTRTASET